MFLPEHIDLAQSEKYILSIRIKTDGFMFSISEEGKGNTYCLRETSFSSEISLFENIKKIVFELSFLTQQYKSTNVIFVSSDYDLVPNPYYQENEKEHLYNFVHSESGEFILSCTNRRQNSVTLYSIEKDIHDFLCRSLYNPQFFHHSSLLVRMFENKENTFNISSKMYLYFHEEMMDVLCFSQSRLTHCLSYNKQHPANQVYYVLKIWECCQMDQLKDIIYIAGTPSKYLESTLQEYIKNIEKTGAPSETFLWSEDAQNAPLDLLELSL